MTGSGIVCVYCKHERPRPRKGEHILLAGLGGKATIHDVCAECNARLGRDVDEEFLRHSLSAFRRLADPKLNKGTVGAVHFMEIDSGNVDVVWKNDRSLDILPQVLLEQTGLRVLCGDDDERGLVMTVLDEVRTRRAKVHRDIKDEPTHRPARLVVDRRGKSHRLRAATADEASALLSAIDRATGPTEEAPLTIRNPKVHLRLLTDVNAPQRCAAKMAFNAATYVFGSEIMRRVPFDPVRDYILGLDVQRPTVIDEDALLVDHRFVTAPEEGNGGVPLVIASDHQLHLGVAAGQLCARLSLFGGAERFWIRLGTVPVEHPERLPIALLSWELGETWILSSANRLWWFNEEPMWPRESAGPRHGSSTHGLR